MKTEKLQQLTEEERNQLINYLGIGINSGHKCGSVFSFNADEFWFYTFNHNSNGVTGIEETELILNDYDIVLCMRNGVDHTNDANILQAFIYFMLKRFGPDWLDNFNKYQDEKVKLLTKVANRNREHIEESVEIFAESLGIKN